MTECQSCKEERKVKGLPPIERIELPIGVTTGPSFRHPDLPTFVCSYCDGETLVSNALKNFKQRQGK